MSYIPSDFPLHWSQEAAHAVNDVTDAEDARMSHV